MKKGSPDDKALHQWCEGLGVNHWARPNPKHGVKIFILRRTPVKGGVQYEVLEDKQDMLRTLLTAESSKARLVKKAKAKGVFKAPKPRGRGRRPLYT